MWLNSASQEVVDLFWERAGAVESFPRDMDRSILRAFPIAIIKLSKLNIQKIETWFLRRGAAISLGCPDRAVHGCLLVRNGSAFIFLDGTDSDEEQRFTLSHELGHFLVEYWIPRRKAILKLGSTIGEVFDGDRLPTVNERISALISGVSLRSFARLMDRNNSSIECSGAETWKAEEEADRIGLSIIAPPELVLKQANTDSPKYAERAENIVKLLTTEFGLPAGIADRFGKALLKSAGKGPSWVENFQA